MPYNVLHNFHKVLTRSIFVTVKSFYSLWSYLNEMVVTLWGQGIDQTCLVMCSIFNLTVVWYGVGDILTYFRQQKYLTTPWLINNAKEL